MIVIGLPGGNTTLKTKRSTLTGTLTGTLRIKKSEEVTKSQGFVIIAKNIMTGFLFPEEGTEREPMTTTTGLGRERLRAS